MSGFYKFMEGNMQKKISEKNDKNTSIISFKTYLSSLKKFFRCWIVIFIAVSFLITCVNVVSETFYSEASASINFSFSGIESGLDPNGNKFEVDEIKSEDIVQAALDELKLTDLDAKEVAKTISIDGIVPLNVIDRITSYESFYNAEEYDYLKYVQDRTYYPTQYKMYINNNNLSNKDEVELINKITEIYADVFNEKYGYNTSMESAVRSIDYREYDYVDAVDVFSTTLGSLKNYINELAKTDNTRFKAENGYTFADVSESIDTIRTENLEWIASYINYNNVTKDRETLIANYEFRIENLKRDKIVAEENIESLNRTIEDYEKDAIIVFGNADGANTSFNKGSGTYDNLIAKKIHAEATASRCTEQIDRYEKRIKSLKNSTTKQSDIEIVEMEFEKLSVKIDSLLEIANETSSEYYNKVKLNNVYTVLSPARSSVVMILKKAVSNSIRTILMFGLFITGIYLSVAMLNSFYEIPFLNFAKKEKNDLKNKKSKKNKK